jgi:hypothetical protein
MGVDPILAASAITLNVQALSPAPSIPTIPRS